MNIVLVQFSPTGGTARAAEALCAGLGQVVQVVDLADPAFAPVEIAEGSAEVAVVALPSFGGLAPSLAMSRLADVTTDGMPCALLAVYGNRAYDDTLVQMRDTAIECGFEVVAAASAVAEHSIIREFAAGRPDAADLATLNSFGQQIAQKLEAGEREMGDAIPGNPDYVVNEGGSGGPYPKASGKCNKCGTCAAKCPAGALDAANPKVPDTKLCASCMRCVSVCPRDARKLGAILTFAVKNSIGAACKDPKECELFL